MSSEYSLKRRAALPSLLVFILTAGLIYRFGESWLRNVLLYLSTAAWARGLVTGLPISKRVAKRFVAGETASEAITVARELNGRGMSVTMDFLGESVNSVEEAHIAHDEILRLLDRINEEGLNATVSVKLSQLGLKLDPDLAYGNVRSLVNKARETNNQLRIDMEESAVVDVTLEIFSRLRFDDGFDNVGIVIQSYLYRSDEDVRKLIAEGASVRLCKGAYKEPINVAYPDKADTDQSFVNLTKMMLGEEARNNGVRLGVATHDEKMIDATKRFAAGEGIDPGLYEFQMLYGIRRDLQEELTDQGYGVRIYLPYGTAWYPYFIRRLAERPANLWFFLSNLIRS
jgi:proline dehydrogenase